MTNKGLVGFECFGYKKVKLYIVAKFLPILAKNEELFLPISAKNEELFLPILAKSLSLQSENNGCSITDD